MSCPFNPVSRTSLTASRSWLPVSYFCSAENFYEKNATGCSLGFLQSTVTTQLLVPSVMHQLSQSRVGQGPVVQVLRCSEDCLESVEGLFS